MLFEHFQSILRFPDVVLIMRQIDPFSTDRAFVAFALNLQALSLQV